LIDVTAFGIEIAVREEHPANAYVLIVVSAELASKETDARDVHPLNAFALIVITDFGTEIAVRAVHP
jgi:hypothetical protein